MTNILKKLGLCIILSLLLFGSINPITTSALTEEQRNLLESNVFYFDEEQAAEICAAILSGSNNEEIVWNYLVTPAPFGMGFSAVQAAGVMGNIQQESGFDPAIVNPDSGAYGLIQWYQGRETALENFAREQGKPKDDIGMQLDFMRVELEGTYRERVLDPILASNDLAEVTRIWLERFEIPCLPGSSACGRELNDIRLPNAQNFLTQFGSGTGEAPISGGGCSGSGGGIDATGCPSGTIDEGDTVMVQGVRVHPCIAQEVDRILTLANSQGLNMSGGGFRTNASQIRLRQQNCPDPVNSRPGACRPPTAIPGQSNHERGTAVDFTCNGSTIRSRSSACYRFLDDNTSLINLPSEPWHWSHNGG